MDRGGQTRDRLQREALRLFTRRGFDDVTVEEIARAAGVSHMTFFRHFPTKESVVMDDPYDPVIGEAVARQNEALPSLERVRRGFLAAWSAVEEPDDDAIRARLRIAAGHPALRARVWENNHATEEVIVSALTDNGVPDSEARISAGAVLGALTAALFNWAREDSSATLGDCVRQALSLLEIRAREAGAA